MNQKLNDFIATNMHSSIDQFYVIFFDEDNDLIITIILFIITTIKSSSISILFIEYRAIAKNKRRYSQAHESITKRLLARLRATMHRLYHTFIEQHLRLKAINLVIRQCVHAFDYDLRRTKNYWSSLKYTLVLTSLFVCVLKYVSLNVIQCVCSNVYSNIFVRMCIRICSNVY